VSDGLCLTQLQAMEMVARRLQLWEEHYGEQLRKMDGGDDALQLDERRLFLGAKRSSGLALVSPELLTWLSSRLGEEAALLKERRKGREERQLAAGETAPLARGPPGGVPDRDGDDKEGSRRRKKGGKKKPEGGQ
jgi:hypothetical protein